jgi:uncharacterized FlaG/YvyC family protein
MNAGIAIKPATGVAVTDYTRPASVPVQEAVATDLSPDHSITVSPATADTRQDNTAAASSQPSSSLRQANQDNLSRGYTIDQQTREVVFRVIDTRTRQVVRQVPDEALLRMRAYAAAVARGQGALADLNTNLSV